jgi:hypothetical protein
LWQPISEFRDGQFAPIFELWYFFLWQNIPDSKFSHFLIIVKFYHVIVLTVENILVLVDDILEWDNRKGRGPQAEQSDCEYKHLSIAHPGKNFYVAPVAFKTMGLAPVAPAPMALAPAPVAPAPTILFSKPTFFQKNKG